MKAARTVKAYRNPLTRIGGNDLEVFEVFEQPGDDNYLTDTTLIDISGLTDLSYHGSISDGTLTVDFVTGMQKRIVPTLWDGWGSPPWVETATPHVLFSEFEVTQTLTLSAPCTIFGFELGPNVFDFFEYTVAFIDSATATTLGTISIDVHGTDGARLFAATTGTSFDTIEITGPAASQGFAIAQVRYALQ